MIQKQTPQRSRGLKKPYLTLEMEAGDGIGLRLSRLQVQNTTFYRVIKPTPRVSKTTPKPQSGVRFGVRLKIVAGALL